MSDVGGQKEKPATLPRKGAREEDARIQAPRPTRWVEGGHSRVDVPTLDDYDNPQNDD